MGRRIGITGHRWIAPWGPSSTLTKAAVTVQTADRPQAGLLGLGQFGRFAATHLRDHLELLATDSRNLASAASELGIGWGNLEEASRLPVILLAVPLQTMRAALRAIAPNLQPGTLVADCGSVKAEPVRWMKELLPEHVEIIGTHPLFGPQSAPDGLHGQRIVLCPVRTNRLGAIVAFLERLGLQVLVIDADEHDRQVACSQALAQIVGRAMVSLVDESPEKLPVRTPSYERLRDAARIVGSDSWELFEAIQTMNPHAAAVRKRLREALSELERRLGQGLDGGVNK